MRVIWKYSLSIEREAEYTVLMPRQAEILTVQAQNDNICLWALVEDDPDYPTEVRHFSIVVTGSSPEDAKYIGTVQLEGVWHVFEEL